MNFHHPYKPYPVQEQFMRIVYDVLEKGHVGILESPTGTVRAWNPPHLWLDYQVNPDSDHDDRANHSL